MKKIIELGTDVDPSINHNVFRQQFGVLSTIISFALTITAAERRAKKYPLSEVAFKKTIVTKLMPQARINKINYSCNRSHDA